MSVSLRSSVIMSVQGAFLGEISPDIRAISVSYVDEIMVNVFFQGVVDEERREDMSCIETVIMSDFPQAVVRLKVVSETGSLSINTIGELVYKRKE